MSHRDALPMAFLTHCNMKTINSRAFCIWDHHDQLLDLGSKRREVDLLLRLKMKLVSVLLYLLVIVFCIIYCEITQFTYVTFRNRITVFSAKTETLSKN
jgi:hypothetical protein